MKCTFCGHRDVDYGKYKEILKATIKDLIVNKNVTIFYLGGYGNFDELCAQTLWELKTSLIQTSNTINESCSKNIRSILALPYRNMIKCKEYYNNIYDEIIFPNIGNCVPRLAIPIRNRWLIDNSDFVVSGTMHTCGGAYKTQCYAEKCNKLIINITQINAKSHS